MNVVSSNWDIKGIWNAQIESPLLNTIEKHYLHSYVNSIDSVYLGADGKLHDTTGFGFADSQSKTLRMNDFTKSIIPYKDSGIIYLCLEGCRRVVKFGWKSTPRSFELISQGRSYWGKLSQQEKEYFYIRIFKKYKSDDMVSVQEHYNKLGWGFVIKEAQVWRSQNN